MRSANIGVTFQNLIFRPSIIFSAQLYGDCKLYFMSIYMTSRVMAHLGHSSQKYAIAEVSWQ